MDVPRLSWKRDVRRPQMGIRLLAIDGDGGLKTHRTLEEKVA
jgi:hypothetical protein